MPGLFGSLYLSSSALRTQQQGVEIAGQNLANVNNPAYARQRLVLATNTPVQTSIGPQGTGVQAVAIQQIRDAMLDGQIQGETSITSLLQAQQSALQNAEAGLGERLEGSTAATGTDSVGATGGLASALSGLFNAFQTLSTSPSSLTSRQGVITQAQQLATQFNQVNQRLDSLHDQLNQSIQTDVASANELLSGIAGLNKQITLAEAGGGGTANDLRDLRQGKLEDLAKLVNFQSATTAEGAVNIVVNGQLLVSGAEVQDRLETYDAGGGQVLVRAAGSGAPLTLTGGSVQGAIEARDNALGSLQGGLNQLAAQLITQVNAVYGNGYDLKGGTGADLFTGTNAGDMGVNAALAGDASKLQVAGVAGAAGDNQVAVALAQLGSAPQAALGGQTFSEHYNTTITGLGFALASVNTQLSEQQAVQNMLDHQRQSVSGVSVDEEMIDLVKYQRAFEASARLVSTIDTMLGEVVNLKQ
jgi:flagellar hook-associated protein 1 FlgK